MMRIEEVKRVEERLKVHLDQRVAEVESERGHDPFLSRLYSHLREFVLRGGKRLRPVCCLMAYSACGGCDPEQDGAYDVALAFELLHNSTLIHDDIMDEDELRRGQPTVWKLLSEHPMCHEDKGSPVSRAGPLFNGSMSRHCVTHGILAGNILLAEGLSLILASKTRKPERTAALARLYAEAQVFANHGQVLDTTQEAPHTDQSYFEMSRMKTGMLFQEAILAGATAAGVLDASSPLLAAFSGFAVDAAIAFQLFDDVMDVDASGSTSKGHAVGSDIRQGKATLLVIRALNSPEATAQDRQLMQSVIDRNCTDDHSVRLAIEAIGRLSLTPVKQLNDSLVASAKAHLRSVQWPNPPAIDYFVQLADFVAHRSI